MFSKNMWLRTDKVVSQELSIFEVGYEDVRPRTPTPYDQLDYYLLHFIVHGQGLFFLNDEVHHLARGDGFMIPPYTDNNYYPLVGDPWSYRWIGVRGTGAGKAIAAALGRETYVYQCKNTNQMDQLFAGVYSSFASDHLYGALGKFYEIIDALIDERIELVRSETDPEKRHVLAALNIIQNRYNDPSLRISAVAAQINIERSYLYKLFMRHMDISPKAYLMQYRINRSTRLLRRSTRTFAEIARQSGFSSYSQFSKTFSRYRHMSPSEFHKRYCLREMNPITSWMS